MSLQIQIRLTDDATEMAHTYGEVLPVSFPLIFNLISDAHSTVFIDAGSGYGTLVLAAVTSFQCKHSIGIEKYADKYQASVDLVTATPESLQSQVTVLLQDVNDTDVLDTLSALEYTTLLYFCNNVAFNSGTISR